MEQSLLDARTQALFRRMCSEKSWQWGYLVEQRRRVPDSVRRFKTCVLDLPPSQIDREIEAIARRPKRIASQLLGPRKESLKLIKESAVLAILLFHYAKTVSPDHPERHLGPEGDVLDHLAAENFPARALVAAARLALDKRAPGRKRGRGGRRHGHDTLTEMQAENGLEIYRTVMGKVPGYGVTGTVKGLAVAFLEYWLDLADIHVSPQTLRRLIKRYRTKLAASHPELLPRRRGKRSVKSNDMSISS